MFVLVRRFKTGLIHVYQKADIPRTVSTAVLTDAQKRRPVLGDLALPRKRPDVAVCVQTSALVFRAAAMSSIAACSGSLTSWPCSRWAAATLWVRLTMN